MRLKAAAMVLATVFFLQAKSQLYVEAGLGYALPIAAQGYKTETSRNYPQFGTPTYNTSLKSGISYGKGVQFDAIMGYMFNENLVAELGINYLAGSKTETDKTTSTGASSTQVATTSAKMLRLLPTLRLTAGKGKVKPYMKAGVAIGVSPKIKLEVDQVGSGTTSNQQLEMTGGVSIGFVGGAGVIFRPNNRWSFYSEIKVISLSWSPKKAVITKAVVNGQDQLRNSTVSQREAVFVNTVSSTSSANSNAPTENLKSQLPFSSVGLSIGVHIALKGKARK
jgi:outer membrane protein W